MPHVILKLYPGRDAAATRAMADAIAAALHDSGDYALENVSVAVEEVEPARWMQDVYAPDIEGRIEQLVRRPGYGPLAEDAA
ncbi:MAG: tautomerase family protein [Luteimonas sp.]